MTATPHTRHIGFVVLEGFTMITFSNAIEAFRMANYVTKHPLYRFSVAGLIHDRTLASNHISINHSAPMEDLLTCDLVFVCGGYDLSSQKNSALRAWLQRFAKHNIALGGICTGAYALADAGVMNGHQSSIHWENLLTAKEKFPQVQFNPTIYTIDRNRYTCSGGASSLDLCIDIIRLHHDRKLSEEIGEQFTLSVLRKGDEPQHIPLPKQCNSGYNYVIEALVLMGKNLEDPLPIYELAPLLNISVRQLERWFKVYFSKSPQQYYTELRLKNAHRLLQQTNMSIMDVALACGFSNPSSFSKAYRGHFLHTPTQARRQVA